MSCINMYHRAAQREKKEGVGVSGGRWKIQPGEADKKRPQDEAKNCHRWIVYISWQVAQDTGVMVASCLYPNRRLAS